MRDIRSRPSIVAVMTWRGGLVVALSLLLSQTLASHGVCAEVSEGLKYSWEEGFVYNCRFDATARVMDREQVLSGLTTFTLSGEDPDTSEAEECESSGTGFLVSSDGHIMTCAHVVEGATEISARFDERSYQATIVHFDEGLDLAVLKIQAQNLPFLGFCDSDKVELAQEVRVVGYPLSSVLGESIKMSRGTISGIAKQKDGNRFQVDARVNPGDSGGPLVDEQGRVVGIASELLSGERIDSVGFAIPSNEAVNLLRSEKITAAMPSDGPKLEGPVLAKRVTPAVCLLRVTIGPGGFGARKKQILKYMSTYSLRGGPSLSLPTVESGKLIVDSAGKITSYDGEDMLPMFFQHGGTIGIELLPGGKRESWKSSRVLILVTEERSSRPSTSLPGFGPPSLSPPSLGPSYRYRSPYRYGSPLLPDSRDQKQYKITEVFEEIAYRRVSQSAGGRIVKIQKEYSLCSANDEDSDAASAPMIDMKTTGTFTWDESIGCVTESSMKGQVSLSQTGITIRVPLKISYKVFKEKPTPRESPPQITSKRPAPRSGPASRPVETKPTPVESAPTSTGLSKFNPND